ncbi:MAG TPA: hypothetical protein VF062_12515 [Candidatus Limnocylindrales bacterium]
MPSVAVEGEVVATAGPATAAGSWTAGPVTEVSYTKLTIGGKKVIHQAMCTFTFTNSTTSATTLVPLTLTASPRKLQGGLSNVLCHADKFVDPNGNQLEARVTRPPTLSSG